ncbi:Ig-like domain-containing protein [Kaistella sp.]|uniref:Ig-like domain-containing protein n=1 Tax=Kaistella sp. TaxID=2782235 RepID=UPI003C42A461
MNKLILLAAMSFATIGITNSCSSDRGNDVISENYSLEPNSVTINYDKTQQLTVKNGSASMTPSEFTWKSSDEKRGYINASGILTAQKVGKFNITATKNGKTATAEVTIAPYHTFFKEPIIGFGKTKAEIKVGESRLLQSETSTSLIYKGENGEITNIGYTFDSSGKMTSAIAIFPSTSSSIEKVTVFYKERYTIVSNESGTVMMKDLDNPIWMGMSIHPTLGYNVIYTKQ